MTETRHFQLTGYSPTPSTATVTIRSFDKPERIRRALKGLATFWGAAIGSVFIPVAHFLLVFLLLSSLIVHGMTVTSNPALFNPAHD